MTPDAAAQIPTPSLPGTADELLPLVYEELRRLAASRMAPQSPGPIVRLHGCLNLTDLSPLAEAREPTTLTLPPNAGNIKFLRDFQKLNRISFTEDFKSYLPDKTSDEWNRCAACRLRTSPSPIRR